jgi:hypothetical protein
MLGKQKTNWSCILFLELWAYWTLAKTATRFTLFQIIYGLEAVLLIGCEISCLKLIFELLTNTFVEEENILYLDHLDEQWRDVSLANETHKWHEKSQYGNSVSDFVFS